MPIAIGELTWTQDSELVKLRVKLNPSVSMRSLDILTHSEYIKLNAPPFYREIFLHQPIDASGSRCRVIDRCVYFELKKRKPCSSWDRLEVELVDKSERMVRKEKIVEDTQTIARQSRESHRQRKVEEKRKDMLLDIDRQTEERRRQESTVQGIRKDVQAEIVTSHQPSLKLNTNPPPLDPAAIRPAGAISVTFSQRSFVTPKRESQTQLELDWLTQQMEAKRSMGFVEEDLGESERNPVWLLAKGNHFYGHGNYLGAISAYSAGIKLNANSVELHLNRAGAQFCAKNYMRCAEDCSRALELIEMGEGSTVTTTEEVKHKKWKIQSLARRGAALCQLGLLAEGYGEMEAAWLLDNTNISLKEDLEAIQRRLEEIS